VVQQRPVQGHGFKGLFSLLLLLVLLVPSLEAVVSNEVEGL
jgi:hypothetical protein